MSARPPGISRRAWEVWKFRVFGGLILLAHIGLARLVALDFFDYIILMIGAPGHAGRSCRGTPNESSETKLGRSLNPFLGPAICSGL